MIRTIAVTGVDGFVGRHVVDAARAAGIEVIGVSRDPISDQGLRDRLVGEVTVDLTQRWPAGIEVDAVVHLAGLAAVGPSFAEPQLYIETNSSMITHLGEALLAQNRPPRIVAASTGAVYSAARGPLDEDAATSPSSPYVVSKLLVESQLGYYAQRGLDVVIARPFNHLGPGQGRGFLVPDLVTALRELPAGESLAVGNLDTARDYTDVRDVARAYVDLATSSAPLASRYNIASGRAVRGRDVLELVASALELPMPPTRVDHARLRATDAETVTGDARRLAQALGWSPRIEIRQSIVDCVAAL